MSSYLQLKKRAFMSIVNGVKGFVRTVSGVPPISLEDCVDSDSLIDYKLYGNSVQDGEPTPEAPVEVQSVGEYDSETGKYKVPVVARGKNLLDRNLSQIGYYGGYITPNGYTINGILWSDLPKYSGQTNTVWYVTYPIPIKPNTFYTYSGLQRANNPAFIFLEEDKTTIISGDVIKSYGTFKTPDNARYIVMSIHVDYVKTMMLEESETVTDYEPYHSPITTNLYLDEPLRKVGDYADYVDFGKGEVVRKVKTLTLSADNLKAISKYKYSYVVDASLNLSSIGGISNIGSYFMGYAHTGSLHWYLLDSSNGIMMISPSEDITIGEYFTNINLETDVNFYYVGAEETHTPITIPKLPTIKGTTIYETGTSLNASNMEATYYSTVKGE